MFGAWITQQKLCQRHFKLTIDSVYIQYEVVHMNRQTLYCMKLHIFLATHNNIICCIQFTYQISWNWLEQILKSDIQTSQLCSTCLTLTGCKHSTENIIIMVTLKEVSNLLDMKFGRNRFLWSNRYCDIVTSWGEEVNVFPSSYMHSYLLY